MQGNITISQLTLYIFSTVLTLNTGIAVYLLQDYIKFRININKEFMSKSECEKQHINDNKYLDEKFRNINQKLDDIMHKLGE